MLIIEMPTGMINITIRKVNISSVVATSTDGKKKPMPKETRIPKVMQIYEIPPAGPLTSTGAVSLIYLGQNTEKLPEASPYKNLPSMRAYQF